MKNWLLLLTFTLCSLTSSLAYAEGYTLYVAPRISYAKHSYDVAEFNASTDKYYTDTVVEFSDSSAAFGIAVGFSSNNASIRPEVEFSYFAETEASESEYGATVTMKNSIKTLFLNVYYDFKNFSPQVIPYINAGLGLAINTSSVEVSIANIKVEAYPENSHYHVAGNLGLGLAFKVNERSFIEGGYRFSVLGLSKTGTSYGYYAGSTDGVLTHQFIAGIRYLF